MLTNERFLECVEENTRRIRAYQDGRDGSDGLSDCIGLIIGAVRLSGEEWAGTHGSNWAARNEIDNLHYVSSPDELHPGDIVFKARNPGDEKYALPSRYKNSGDLLDYYHVGVVTSVKPLTIKHCTGVPGGIKVDHQLGQWRYAGQLKYIERGGKSTMEELYRAIVTADSGNWVRMRNKPSLTAYVEAEVPLGVPVSVIEETNASWAKVGVDGKVGYMMRKFLKKAECDEGNVTITLDKDAALALYTALNGVLGV